jgi:hypothetical protein
MKNKIKGMTGRAIEVEAYSRQSVIMVTIQGEEGDCKAIALEPHEAVALAAMLASATKEVA